MAAANQIKAAKTVLAAVKNADDEASDEAAENVTSVYDLDGLEAGTITLTDDGYAYDVDGVQGDAASIEEALEAIKDETGNADLVTSEAIASRRRAHLRKNLKIARREARRIRVSDRRRTSASRNASKKVAEQWVQLTPGYDYLDDVAGAHGLAVKGWTPTDNSIEGNVYLFEDGTYGFDDVDGNAEDGFKTLNEAKNALLKAYGRKTVFSQAGRTSASRMNVNRKAALTAARKAALAAARKKAAAKTPSIVQRSAAAIKPGFELI